MKVEVWLTTCQQQDGETDENRLKAVGTLTTTADGMRLCYHEPACDGAKGAAVCLTASPERLTLERQGEMQSYMVFVPDKRCPCRYCTPYGELRLYTLCTALECTLTAGGGRVFAAYQLEMGEGAPVECTMEITVKEVSE